MAVSFCHFRRLSCACVSIFTIGGLIVCVTYLSNSLPPAPTYRSFQAFHIVESYGKLSNDFDLHEWFSKALADTATEVLVNDTVQRVTSRDEPATYNTSRIPVVLFNVLPKTGSRTLVMLVHKVRSLGTINNITMSNSMDLRKTPEEKIKQINETLACRKNPSFIYSHLKFIKFGQDEGTPMYISIIRDPIDRLVSLYYFKRYGDSFSENSTKMSQMFKEKMKARNLIDASFDECVSMQQKECFSEWALNSLVYHYSGYDNLCDNHDWECMSAKAKENVKKHYTLVGMLEDYHNFVRVLEKMIPEVFLGIDSFYRSDFAEMKTRQKLPPSEKVRNILRQNMKNDYDFYEFVKSEFSLLKQKLGL